MSIEGAYLRSIIVRIEALEAERREANEKIKALYKQVRVTGVVSGSLRRLIRERKVGREKIEREAAQVAGLEKLAGDI